MAIHKPKQAQDELDWFTVTYRTIYIAVGFVFLLAAAGGYFYYARHKRPVATATPDTAPSMTTAQFTSLTNRVQVKAAGTFVWVPADRRTPLRRGDFVQTGPGSAAEITFFDGTVINVKAETLITIEDSSQDPQTNVRRVKTKITSGMVNFTTPHQNVPGSATEFTTQNFRANPGGDTEGSVSTAESGPGEVKIFRGTSTVRTSAGDEVSVGTNTALPVSKEGKAGPTVTLPAIPVLQAPPHQAEISYPDPARATTLLAWKAVPGAAAYHVVLDVDAFFVKPLVDRSNIKETQVELRVDSGKYYWRVAAVDKDGNEGAFSEFARFTVTRPSGSGAAAAAPAKLTIESLDVQGNILQAKGTTEPGATVTVNGQRVDVQPNGTFNEFITLENPGRQVVVVRAVNINGGVNEQRRAIVVGY